MQVAERRERHVDVAVGDVDRRVPAELGGVARDVARALAVPHDPQRLRPFLFQGTGSPVVASTPRGGVVSEVSRIAASLASNGRANAAAAEE